MEHIMSESKPKYCVFGNEYVLFMNGDRAETKAQHSEDEFIFDADSLEECRAAARKWAEEQEAPRVIHYSGGIGSIVYNAADVYENEYDEDGDLLEATSVDAASTLTDELLDRFERAKRSYYAWLDHESDSYEEI